MARYEQVQRHVIDARYLGDYKVWLEFNDGRKGVVDLADDLYGENFEPLRDRDRFAEFYLDYGLATIAWHHGVDFAPGLPVRQAERDALTGACPAASPDRTPSMPTHRTDTTASLRRTHDVPRDTSPRRTHTTTRMRTRSFATC